MKKIVISVVSLLICVAGSGVFGSSPNHVVHAAHAAKAVLVKSKLKITHLPPVATANSFSEFKLQPRLNLWGASGDNTLGEGQILIPFYGDPAKVLYGLAEGNITVNNNGWLAGGGLGYRQVINSERIYGGYLLADYNNTPDNNGFWVANPGIEMLGKIWDVGFNGYLSLGNKKTVGPVKYVDDLVDVNTKRAGLDDAKKYIRFSKNSEYVHEFQLTEEAGRGFDFKIGRTIPHLDKAKLYLGGYHFDTNDFGSANGVIAKLTYDFNRYAALEVEDTNDNVYHNKVLLKVRLSFGGYGNEEKQKFGISSRLLDPINNDLVLLNGSSKAPIKSQYIDKGEKLRHDNLVFFKPTGTGDDRQGVKDFSDAANGDGTYEHPFIGLTQVNKNAINYNLGKIDPYPLLYFAPGTYNLSAYDDNTKRFDLPNGWGMYGRTADYTMPAMNDNRALFKGGINLNYFAEGGKQQTTLDSIRIYNDNETTKFNDSASVALYAINAGNVVIKNSEIKNEVNTPFIRYLYGIYADNSNINFNGNENNISGASTANTLYASYGIYAKNSALTFGGGMNKISSSSAAGGYGIYVENSPLTFMGGKNSIYNYSESNESYGIYAHNSNIIFKGGENSISSINDALILYGSYGVYANNSSITFAGGANAISGSSKNVEGYGIYSQNNSPITFSGGASTIAASSDYGTSFGIYFADVGSPQITFLGKKAAVNINTFGAAQYGIYTKNDLVLRTDDESFAIKPGNVDWIKSIFEKYNITIASSGIGKVVKIHVSDGDIDW